MKMDNENSVEQTQPKNHGKTLTKSRIVNNIDEFLNEDNLGTIHYLNRNWKLKTFTSFLVQKSNKNTPTIEWQREFPNVQLMSFALRSCH